MIPIEPCEGEALTLTVRSLPGVHLAAGWSGIWHGALATHEHLVSVTLDCPGDTCTIDGSNLVRRGFGAPLPLSAAGVSVCVLASFREPVTGTYSTCNG